MPQPVIDTHRWWHAILVFASTFRSHYFFLFLPQISPLFPAFTATKLCHSRDCEPPNKIFFHVSASPIGTLISVSVKLCFNRPLGYHDNQCHRSASLGLCWIFICILHWPLMAECGGVGGGIWSCISEHISRKSMIYKTGIVCSCACFVFYKLKYFFE